MARFQYQKKQNTYRKFLLSVCAFLLIIVLFCQGIESLSSSSIRRQKESLENALNRNITYCYAVEGAYPESLDYLKEHYGLTYDEDRFFVDYKVIGSNILPDVTIIEKGD
ncbi:hypothetical protein HGO97_012480 [Faecalicatena sp. AGMB00832]|uniref:Uncharacterized protein n=1 Tax=Faecalicatena faecalis TaxID=2726362 RepID=A0ABS6D4V5_9FIRM|nr:MULTISPECIES: hypothetical protein [Faecalicatena]MBU3876620.1 hypothetical protein [Faecalicatena faecalis]MCI6464675.1 hypothetical protein [Faecalicatena sp.]MDY5618253.1 hypothetical protein [Lachnospiraceae bacterium]